VQGDFLLYLLKQVWIHSVDCLVWTMWISFHLWIK